MATRKITQADIEAFRSLKKRQEDLQRRIDDEKVKMVALFDSMDAAAAAQQDGSVSPATVAADRKGHEHLLEGYVLAVVRLEEDYDQVMKELEELQGPSFY